jgi:hypothetical protein
MGVSMLGACSDLLLQQQQQRVRIVGREQQTCYSSCYCNPKSSTHFSRSSPSLAFVSRSRIAAASKEGGVGQRRISGRKTEGRKSFCADQWHQSCKNLAGCSKKRKKSWRILASSSATVAAEVHSFLFLVYSEILSVSLSLHFLPLGGAKYLVILGWVVGRVQGIIMGMGRRCSLKRERQLRAFLMMILE